MRVRNLLIYFAVVGTVFFLYWYIKSFSPETMDVILRLGVWVEPYYLLLFIIILISFLLSIIFDIFDKDFDKEEIEKKGPLRYFAANFPNNSTINTKPLANFFAVLFIVVFFATIFLFLAPEIFQVEAPEIQEIYNEYKRNKGE